MIHATPVRLILVVAMALIGLGVLSGGALGQAASPVAGTPVEGAEAAGLSAADMAYLDAMTPIVTTVQDSLVRYVSLTSDPQPDKLDWLEKFAFELMRWRSAYQDTLALNPPSLFAESHNRYLEALGLLAETSDTANVAVNDGDLAGLMQAGARILQATRLFDQATVLMRGAAGEQGGELPIATPVGAMPVAGPGASAANLTETALNAAISTPPTGGAGPAQVNVMVEVNTYVGLGDLSTGGHTFQFTKVRPPLAIAQEATPSTTTLKLVEHAVHLTTIDHGDPGPSVGDVQVWGPNPLYDARDDADTGATTQGICTALNAAFDCIVTETILFADGSTLQIQGVEFAAAPSHRTIVGGSGAYLGATGAVAVEPTQDQSRWAKTLEIHLPDDKS